MSGTIAQLKELKELLDGGVLTQGEFDAQKSVILAGQAQSTMSGKPTGPRFDSSTGQPIPKFDTQTGKQNWWDEEGGQQLGLPPPPAIMMQPGMVDEKTYNVAVPPGPLGVQFLDPTCTVHAVKPTSPLRGVTKEGDTLLSVNGTMVTGTTMLDDIKAADDGTSERKLVFRGRVKTTPALPDGPNATGQTRLSMMQPVAGINAAGQMVDASGRTVVMDGGGRVWSAPYSKIMANEVDGCYCTWGLIPLWAASSVTSEGEDTYTETGVCAFWGLWPFCIKFRRIPNTNTFRDDGCATQKWSRDSTGQITVIDNCPTVCCMNKC